ncbi:Ribosomal RNA-processing protein 8 [Camellia lanceoleosa]|uniref:Ribosomal RNA-processing protein 8 n=1 Tax=Camellia lanceoleosa TaxID=1840588 RepID=A0ACC0HTV2_9ERIC|nr:Ribosomal RNA-processing protein 8 [Camellia lanceoleosa]
MIVMLYVQRKEVAGILLPNRRTCLLQDFSNKMSILLYFKKKEKQNSKREIEWPELKPCLYKRRLSFWPFLGMSWLTYLGLAPKKTASPVQEKQGKQPSPIQNGTSDEARRLTAAALSAVKDAVALAAASGKGKVEKFVDADSKEASEKAKATVGRPSAVDAILEQIRKKQKLSLLDKTKKDWEHTRKKARAWKMSWMLTRRAQISTGSNNASL